MPGEVTEVVLGLVTNALWAVGSSLARAGAADGSGRMETEIQIANTLDPELIRRAADDRLRAEDLPPGCTSEHVIAILHAADTSALIHELLTARLLGLSGVDVDRIASGFDRLASLQSLGLPQEQCSSLGGVLFDVLDEVCIGVVERIDSVDVETRAAIQNLAGLSSLTSVAKSIERHLEALHSREAADEVRWRAYEANYLDQVQARHGWLVLPDFEIERRVETERLYVEPVIRWASGRTSRRAEEPLQSELRSVLLGNPGGGKSTLASVAAFRVARDRSAVPFLVVLREYSQDYAAGLSIVQHIEKVLNTRYQSTPPERWVDAKLVASNSVVVFDGLDELVDATSRRAIRGAVEAFCENYPFARVLVTSRKVGYDLAPLSSSRFALAELDEFDDTSVATYVSNWFEHSLSHLSPNERQTRIDGFLSESDSVSELRTNPLLLSLMCVLYRGSNYIPESRLNLYEECARLLFMKWDRSRDIAVPLEIGPDIEAALMHLAFWIMSEGTAAVGVTESALIRQCTRYLRERRYEDDAQAESAATEFVRFCRGRAWVLTEAGTSADGEPLYTFAHRTFLEYYTAFHISRKRGSPEGIADELASRLARSEWDVVGQLAVQIANKYHDLGADRLLTGLLDSLGDAGGDVRTSVLRFVAGALQYTIPSPATVRRISQECLELALEGAREAPEIIFSEERAYWDTPLNLLLGTLPASRSLVADELAVRAGERLAGPANADLRRTARTYALCALAAALARPPEGRRFEAYAYWKAWSKSVLDQFPWDDNWDVDGGTAAMAAVEVGQMTIGDFLDRHSPRLLFDAPHDDALGFRRLGTLAIVAGWLDGQFIGHLFAVPTVNLLLRQVPSAFSRDRLPLPGGAPAWSPSSRALMRDDRFAEVEAEALGGGIVLMCLCLEGNPTEGAEPPKAPRRFRDRAHRALRLSFSLAEVRRAGGTGEVDSAVAPLLSVLDDEVRDLLLAWSRGTVSFWSEP